MAEITLMLEGKHFKRQYLLYIVEVIHGKDRYYYIGQTGDNNYTTARPAFRRLSGHLEDIGQSTQNQVYRYLAVEVLGISEANRRDLAFNKKIKQSVEDYLVNSTIKMHIYSLQSFVSSIGRSQHRNIVKKVVSFERIIIQLFLASSKIIINKKRIKSKENAEGYYQKALDEIVADFKLQTNK